MAPIIIYSTWNELISSLIAYEQFMYHTLAAACIQNRKKLVVIVNLIDTKEWVLIFSVCSI